MDSTAISFSFSKICLEQPEHYGLPLLKFLVQMISETPELNNNIKSSLKALFNFLIK